eukprot:g6087.t1
MKNHFVFLYLLFSFCLSDDKLYLANYIGCFAKVSDEAIEHWEMGTLQMCLHAAVLAESSWFVAEPAEDGKNRYARCGWGGDFTVGGEVASIRCKNPDNGSVFSVYEVSELAAEAKKKEKKVNSVGVNENKVVKRRKLFDVKRDCASNPSCRGFAIWNYPPELLHVSRKKSRTPIVRLSREKPKEAASQQSQLEEEDALIGSVYHPKEKSRSPNEDVVADLPDQFLVSSRFLNEGNVNKLHPFPEAEIVYIKNKFKYRGCMPALHWSPGNSSLNALYQKLSERFINFKWSKAAASQIQVAKGKTYTGCADECTPNIS